MKRLITLLVMLSVLVLSIPAFAEIPPYIQFQGKATDDGGIPLVGTYKLTFRIYNVEAGEDPPIWSETHNVVEIEGGVFSVLLGEVNPLNIPFDKSYWISMEIGTIDRLNELPRQLISSVGYAYRAKTAATLDVQTQDLDMGGHKIINVVDPTATQDVATKKYVDNLTIGMANRKVFTASGTFTAPPGVNLVYLTMVGGGGGGGRGHDGDLPYNGGGGGSGAYVIRAVYPVNGGSNYSVTVGAAGLGGIPSGGNGTAGGSTKFATITVSGGGGGINGTGSNNGEGGAGGAAGASLAPSGKTGGAGWTDGVLINAGQTGARGQGAGNGGGGGGGSPFGAAGSGVNNAAGTSATSYGAGGGGGDKFNYAGGNGTAGIVIVEW